MNFKIRRILKIKKYKGKWTLAKIIQYVKTELDLKTRFIWEKLKHMITSETASIMLQCSLKFGITFLCEW